MARKLCEKCKRDLQDTNFYTYRNGEKAELCKSCLTMHIDNYNPQTFLWILQKFDVPWLPWEWDVIRDKAYAKNPTKMNGMSVIGKYFSKMKLRQFNKDRWADSEKLQAEHEKQMKARQILEDAEADLARQQYERGQISEAQYRTLVSTAYQRKYDIPSPKVVDPIGEDNMYNENDFLAEQDLPNDAVQLTLEEKQYLAMKWGRTYKVSEWLELEQKYTEMMNSFDIQDADSKNSLIFICKTYLKMNQAIDCGDVEGYQKLSRVYDALRKSANFTAAQNKQDKTDFVDSVGQLVAYCEKYGGKIPRYEIKAPYDKIDKIINDLKEYTKSLIYEDTALARQIQDYIKQARAINERKKDREEAKSKGLKDYELSDQDLINFKNFQQEESLQTTKITQGENNEL